MSSYETLMIVLTIIGIIVKLLLIIIDKNKDTKK